MKNPFIKGTAGLVIDNAGGERWRNFDLDERVAQFIFLDTARGDRNTVTRGHLTKSVGFMRPGPLRYLKRDELLFAHPDWAMRNDAAFDQYYEPSNYNAMYADIRRHRNYYYGPGPLSTANYATTERSTTWGAIGWILRDWRGLPEASPQTTQGFPDYGRRWPIQSWIDVPGYEIGNIFPHPTGRTAWFDEAGQTANSQGSIEIDGVYDPPENMLDHYGYQIYYTKTGGTGRVGDPANPDLTSPIDGTAGSVTTSSDTFTDGAAQGLFSVGVHDQGNHYIRIQSGPNRGTYLITSVTDVNNVVVDATAINEPFTTESSIAWEMVSGPVGEYFWRRRPDHSYEYWSSTGTYNYGTVPLAVGLYHEIDGSLDQRTPARTLHDRGACWWGGLYRSDSVLTEGRLFRYVHMSPQAFEPMNDASKWSGTWPTGLNSFTDLKMDDQNKMWIAHRSDNATKNGADCLIRVDPYPSGNALTPAVLTTWDRQTDAADASGLVNADCWGLLADDSQAYAAGTRIWIFHYNDDQTGSYGGISYSDDYGVTWKRLHELTGATGTASVSVGTGAVTGLGTAFDTEFAVGDWVRFAGDARSYEITAITDATNMTIAPNHATGVSGVTIQKGALATDQTRVYANGGVGNSNGGTYINQGISFDWDTDGNIYWLNSERTKVLKWDESAGQVSEVTTTQLSTSQTITSGSQLWSLTVQRVPNPHGVQDHPLNNVIWVGTSSQGAAAVFPVFDGSHCRYHWNNVNNWPTTMDFTVGTTIYDTGVVVEPTTGMAFMCAHHQSSHGDNIKYSIFGQYNGLPNTRIGILLNNGGSVPWTTGNQVSGRHARHIAQYDDLGMGRSLCFTGSGAINNGYNSYAGIGAGFWICWRWTGTAWVKGPVNAFERDLYMRGSGDATYSMPFVEYPLALGAGTRRMHPGWEELDPDCGMRLRFVDADQQSTSQDLQFLVDENSTFRCSLGRGKDNTQEARYFGEMYTVPTVLRENYESVKNVESIWSVDGGMDGGFTTSSSAGAFVGHQRGVAEYDYYATRSEVGSPYNELFVNHTGQSPDRYKSYKATQRIKPEGEFAADGSTTAASDVFTSAGGHTFVPGDVGKSIVVEGVNGATPDVDNGQAVIIAWISGTQVQTDKTFAATNGSLRWKLMDIPAVAYVILAFEYTYLQNLMRYHSWWLYSSSDHGVNWNLVKQSLYLNVNGAANEPDWTSVRDPGVYWSDNGYMRGSLSVTTDATATFSLVYDLTDLPENVRRRQNWKIRTYDYVSHGNLMRLGSIQLLDENRHPMIPANNKMDDRDDPIFDGSFPLRVRLRVHDGLNTASAVDDGDGDNYTDQVSMAGENFYLQTGVNNAQLSGNDFIGGTWVPEDVGKFIRVANANNAENNGWALVTAYVGAGQVATDKAFTAETNTFDWQVTWVGENDLLKVDIAAAHPILAQSLAIQEFAIADVPTASTLTLLAKEMPLGVSGSFVVNRTIPDGFSEANITTGFDSLQRISHDPERGIYNNMSLGLEFVVLEEDLGSPTATTGADTDGDGRVDTVILPVTLVTEAVAGDLIMLDGTGGRRVYEIASITRDNPGPGQTTVVVTYDELFPSGTFTWQVYRRRGLKFEADRMLYLLLDGTP